VTSAKSLWDSAIHHLTTRDNAFVVKPWQQFFTPKEISMTPANAKEKAKAMKAAAKKIAAQGIAKFKHQPGEASPGVQAIWPETTKRGIDTTPSGVVQSDCSTTTTENSTMTTVESAEKDLADRKAAAKAEAIAKREAEKKEAEAKRETEKAAKAAERAEKAEKAKAESTAKREAALAAKQAAAEGTKRTYFGPMTALAERVKNGAYTKGMTGQLRSNDDLALALDAVPTDNVIKLALIALGLPGMPDKYAGLNRGQQSMNLRNRLRGALKADEGKGLLVDGQHVTIERIKAIRDANNFATAEDDAAKKAEAKKLKEEAAAAKKALEAAEKAKRAETKAANEPSQSATA